MSGPLLEVERLSVSYGAIRAVRGVSLSVARGEVVALLGANGAGKSSLLAGIMGLVRRAGGEVRFRGRSLARRPTEAVASDGLVLVFEGRRVFPKLTLRENLLLGGVAGRGRSNPDAKLAEIETAFPALAERRDQMAGTLSGGEQQMLAIARALMSEPEMILLDEPSLGLAPRMVDTVFGMIAGLKAAGTTMLIVEQNVEMGLSVADRGYVMQNGEIVQAGSATELSASSAIRDAYIGAA